MDGYEKLVKMLEDNKYLERYFSNEKDFSLNYGKLKIDYSKSDAMERLSRFFSAYAMIGIKRGLDLETVIDGIREKALLVKLLERLLADTLARVRKNLAEWLAAPR